MYFLLSGEGATDMGSAHFHDQVCEGEHFTLGPMAVIVDQIVESAGSYSPISLSCCGFVSKQSLSRTAKKRLRARRKLRLPGKKVRKETAYFYQNARSLAWWAREIAQERNDHVVAVLFRDSDGTASSGRGLWRDKWDSMQKGFEAEEFYRGVPMLPKPKSEAWILCALQQDPYRNCWRLEERSGNDNSPHALKKELVAILGQLPAREELCRMAHDRTINIDMLDMSSFSAFRSRLESAIGEI